VIAIVSQRKIFFDTNNTIFKLSCDDCHIGKSYELGLLHYNSGILGLLIFSASLAGLEVGKQIEVTAETRHNIGTN
jgi:hypothetical protein